MIETNKYFEVLKPFDLVVHNGYKQLNDWLGSARVLSPILNNYTTQVGDEIHFLHGGCFLVTKDKKTYVCRLFSSKALELSSYDKERLNAKQLQELLDEKAIQLLNRK